MYFLAGEEKNSCMQFWNELPEDMLLTLAANDEDDESQDGLVPFEKYLRQVSNDIDLTEFDQSKLDNILLIPNTSKLNVADDSMLVASLDTRAMGLLRSRRDLLDSPQR